MGLLGSKQSLLAELVSFYVSSMMPIELQNESSLNHLLLGYLVSVT